MSFLSQMMEPGGGVLLLPFVRVVIGLLLLLTTFAAILGLARIHMIILSFLSGGLLLSLYFFENEYNKMKASSSSRSAASHDNEIKSSKKGVASKTD
jgi:hypothetical protein